MPYAHASPAWPTTRPPSAGPITPAPFHITWLSAADCASRFDGTRFGVIAARVGIEIDTNAAFSAAAPYRRASGGCAGEEGGGRMPGDRPRQQQERRRHEPDLRGDEQHPTVAPVDLRPEAN